MISITTTTSQTNAAVLIKNYKVGSDIQDGSARISKNKTLDGAVAIIHNGFVEGDRTLKVEGRLSETESDVLWDIFSTETFVNIAIPDGLFDGVIARLKRKYGVITMTLELKEKLTS